MNTVLIYYHLKLILVKKKNPVNPNIENLIIPI